MKELSIKIHVGIGDLIYTKSMLDQTAHIYSKINIAPNLFLIHERPDYKKFLMKLMGLLFKPPFYNINENQNYTNADIMELWKGYNFSMQKPNFSNILCTEPLPNIFINLNYIVINTKVRAFPFGTYNAQKNNIFDILSKSPYKIVILGEREIEYSEEYQRHGNEKIYSIYNDIINNLPESKIIDMTVPKLGITPPDLDKFLTDCTILHNAKRIISIGGGGAFCTSTAVGNVIAWMDFDELYFFTPIYKNIRYPDAFVTDDLESFLNELRSIK